MDIVFHQLGLGYGAAVALSVTQLSLSEARLVMLRMLNSRYFDIIDKENSIGARSPRKALDLLTMLVQLRPEMAASCFDVLDQLFLNPDSCMRLFRFRDHPILRIHAEEDLNIPKICRTPLSELQLRFSQDCMYRWKNWKLLESAGHPVESRLLQLNAVLLNAVAQEWCWTPDFFDAAFDLFDFLSYSQVPELRRAATDQLIACISVSRDSWGPLSIVLDLVSRSAILGPRPSKLRYSTYTPKTPSSPTVQTDAETPPELSLQLHPQLHEFLQYAHLQPHGREAHLQFWQHSLLAVPAPEISDKSLRALWGVYVNPRASGDGLQSRIPTPRKDIVVNQGSALRARRMGALNTYRISGVMEGEEDVTQRVDSVPSAVLVVRQVAEASAGSGSSGLSKSFSMQRQDIDVTSPDIILPVEPVEPIPEFIQDPVAQMWSHNYSLEDIAYNTDGDLVGATMDVLVEKMTPHDSIVDHALTAVFFLTFRLFSSPIELVDTIIQRYNILPPDGISNEDVYLWQQRKGIPVRLRLSNFIKIWVETYWRQGVDDPALDPLANFIQDGLAVTFPGPAQRIKDLIELCRIEEPFIARRRRQQTVKSVISPKMGEIPRPMISRILLANLRSKNFATIAITDFDPLELARQLTIVECDLYCDIQLEEVLEEGRDGVKAVSGLSTAITGWISESILSEPDMKKRTTLIKFFIKVADRCTFLNNYSTPWSILAALDSSTIFRLHQTWLGVPQKNRSQLDSIRRLADHSRNYHEYRSKLRNTAPPAVPFLGLYLTDVTFCRKGIPSHRASPMNPHKKLLNFNKYHKLARIVHDMQRFQVPYQLHRIPEVLEYLVDALETSQRHGIEKLQDLYRRSLLVEPKEAVDTIVAADRQQLFGWGSKSQATTPS